ncbi:hypothetical protein GCM10010297_53470 [Streptomyces malachitofuscus]|nr:hypothetical protein GCM10010297_53470 [Streptomyces malachitofuscus]
MIDRQPEVREALHERFGDRLVVLDEQHSYAHVSRLSVKHDGNKRGRRVLHCAARWSTRYKKKAFSVAQEKESDIPVRVLSLA